MATGLPAGRVAAAEALRAAVESLRAGRVEEAFRTVQEVLRAVPGDPGALHLAAIALTRLGRPDDAHAAVASLHGVAAGDPMNFDATQRVVSWVAEAVTTPQTARRPAMLPDASAAWKRVAVGFCSIDAAREERARRSLEAALAPSPCEFHVVHHPRSLAEGFNRILDAAEGDLVILCHDDIEVLTTRLDLALQRALSAADLVGVAGSTRVSGPAVLWEGHPHIHGWVTYPREGGLEVAPLSLRCGNIGGIEALDGVFMAMRAGAARELRFDAETFDGFHFYDLDLSYRAHRAGMRLAVSTDVLLLHASEGSFGESWRRYAERFLAKYPACNGAKGAAHWYGARVKSPEQAIAFYDELRALEGARGVTETAT